jgi:LmbE family N-acetylglucosaminyl deacetylase
VSVTNRQPEVFVPDGTDPDSALSRTTHLAVGAHPDDVAVFAFHGIVECRGRDDRWFTAVTATDGSGSPRSGPFADYSDVEMRRVRAAEERAAAETGDYSATVLLDYSSSYVKGAANTDVGEVIADVLQKSTPGVVYTHNPADRHDTHVAVAVRTIAAIRSLPPVDRPRLLYGCEVWRDLDWLTGSARVTLDVSGHDGFARELLRVYQSQIAGGKRYDDATLGRRHAHATYAESHAVDTATAVTLAMDLTPLIGETGVATADHLKGVLETMRDDVLDRIRRVE